MAYISLLTYVLATLTLIGGIALAMQLVYIFLRKIFGLNPAILDASWRFVRKHALLLSFIVALIATSGSLFFSEIAGYTPCKLCWFQRIFMYPLVILLGIALLKKSRDIRYYAITLAILGGLFSIYHYISQRMEYSATCKVEAVSCSSYYTFHYGYITIPMMALTAFALIIALVSVWEGKKFRKG